MINHITVCRQLTTIHISVNYVCTLGHMSRILELQKKFVSRMLSLQTATAALALGGGGARFLVSIS